MQLKVQPQNNNSYPLGGVLIKGNTAYGWLQAISAMGLQLTNNLVYPIPGKTVNSLWGCLLVLTPNDRVTDIGAHRYCQKIRERLFIPEMASLYPNLSDEEIDRIFINNAYLLHPETGLVELDKPIDWASLLETPKQVDASIQTPADKIWIPSTLHSFEVHSVSPEDILENLEQTGFPSPEKMDEQPLSPLEKIKLNIYKSLFKEDGKGAMGNGQNSGAGNGSGLSGQNIDKTGLMKGLEQMANFFSKQGAAWGNRMQQDYEELMRRNQKTMERFMEMLRNNPEEALKYAIPLDKDGVGRGGEVGALDLEKMWKDFDLFRNSQPNSGGSGGNTLESNMFFKLMEQYRKTAEALIRKGDFKKAAFVYLKLLKNYLLAAQTLEKGLLFAEAAAVYLKFLNDKRKAAECYEKANMMAKAIELYKELEDWEKVGDLYMRLNMTEEARKFYDMVIENYIKNNQFVKASLIYRYKIGDASLAQSLLKKGWLEGKDAYNCLNNYFVNISDTQILAKEIEQIYSHEIPKGQYSLFLTAIRWEHEKHLDIRDLTLGIAYEIISSHPQLLSELRYFNEDKQLGKDIMRYKAS